MRLDFITSIATFAIISLMIVYSYIEAQNWILNYDIYAWTLAEKAAKLIVSEHSIRTSAYIIVSVLSQGNIRVYTIGVKPAVVLGKAYTYRILSNGTLIKVEVWISSLHDYVEP